METNNRLLSSQADLERRLIEAIDACNAARQREESAEQRYRRASRRARVLGGFGLALVVGMLSLVTLVPVGAQSGTPTLAQLAMRVINLETKTQFMTANKEKQSTWFTGCNVYVQSGSGKTDDGVSTGGSLPGLGNLIVGYNATGRSDGDFRTGSHNLILGDYNNFSSFGGLLAGLNNTISAPYASVTGGKFNTTSGLVASVSGGVFNTASGVNSSISGGTYNTASGYIAAISGGQSNTANGQSASISGGGFNTASGQLASICGGASNKASNTYSTVLGGASNEAYGYYSIVCGGKFCSAGGFNPAGDFTANLGGFGTGVVTQYGHNP